MSGASYQSVSAWFRTTTGGGVIFSSSADPVGNGTTAGQYTPSLYIGNGGDLNAEFWNGTPDPILSSAPVNDGKWHLAVLTGAGNTQTLYVDGKPQATRSGAIAMHPQNNDYAGAGFIGGNWPNEPHQNSSSNTGYATYFNGNLSDNSPLGSATTPSGYTPSLYVGQGGDLNAQFWINNTAKVITSPSPVL